MNLLRKCTLLNCLARLSSLRSKWSTNDYISVETIFTASVYNFWVFLSPQIILSKFKKVSKELSLVPSEFNHNSWFRSKLQPATLLKKSLWHKCFPVNFAKFLRATFFAEHLQMTASVNNLRALSLKIRY